MAIDLIAIDLIAFGSISLALIPLDSEPSRLQLDVLKSDLSQRLTSPAALASRRRWLLPPSPARLLIACS